jgi:hypothetical protein
LLADKQHADSVEFRRFRRNLFHGSLSRIIQRLRLGMNKFEVLRYGDGYYRRTIYGLSPYIADYPEQVLLACVVQGWCPRYDLTFQMLSPDWDWCRCDARWDNLDHAAGRRSHRLTEALWDDYGMIDGIMDGT